MHSAVRSVFVWKKGRKQHEHQPELQSVLLYFSFFFFSHFLFTFKQLLFYIERQFDIIYKLLCSEPVVPPYKKETSVSTLHTKI